jgi:hypothetical protein
MGRASSACATGRSGSPKNKNQSIQNVTAAAHARLVHCCIFKWKSFRPCRANLGAAFADDARQAAIPCAAPEGAVVTWWVVPRHSRTRMVPVGRRRRLRRDRALGSYNHARGEPQCRPGPNGQLENLERLSRAELRILWTEELSKSPPASPGRELLALGVAYARQEQQYGATVF